MIFLFTIVIVTLSILLLHVFVRCFFNCLWSLVLMPNTHGQSCTAVNHGWALVLINPLPYYYAARAFGKNCILLWE